MQKQWQLQDAKNHFSKVVQEALHGGPQIITHKGVKTAIILSIHEYEGLIAPKTGIVDFFRKSPLYGIELDLKRDKDTPREVEL